MYRDNDHIKMTPTRCSVIITSESGDEPISLDSSFEGQNDMYHNNIASL